MHASFHPSLPGNQLEFHELASSENREKLAQLMARLFEHWQLDTASQLNLLGLSENSRALLSKYRTGTAALPATRDTLDRAGWLLAIHKALRLLYPRNPALRYGWVHAPNRAFENFTPLEIMKQRGLIGIAIVARYLDFQRGR
jgi:hypothetical protein